MSTESAALVVARLVDLLSVAVSLLTEAQKVSEMIETAREEGRTISPEEWQQLDDALAQARERAREAIS